MKKNLKNITAILTAAALIAAQTVTAPLCVFADDPPVIESGESSFANDPVIVYGDSGQTIQTEGMVTGEGGYTYTEDQWERLMDNVMEYDEIADLVHNFNTTITTIWDNLADTQDDLQRSVTELESQRRKMKDLKDDAKDNGEIDNQITYAMNEAIFDAVISGLVPTLNSLYYSNTTRASINKAEEQITQVVQSLMIAYDSMSKQADTLSAMIELYEAQYKLVCDEQALGMATENEVLTARNNLLSAQSSYMSLQSGLATLLPTLCTLTGWPADAHPEIAPIPTTDLSRIEAMNLEEDTVKAIGNNSDLISQRTSARGETYDEVSRRLGWINEGEEKLTVIMKGLYDDVYTQLTAFQAASTGWEAAQREQQSNQHMYELGMMSRSEYLATQLSYYQSKASYEAADTSLLLAIETYYWAVLGLVSVE